MGAGAGALTRTPAGVTHLEPLESKVIKLEEGANLACPIPSVPTDWGLTSSGEAPQNVWGRLEALLSVGLGCASWPWSSRSREATVSLWLLRHSTSNGSPLGAARG